MVEVVNITKPEQIFSDEQGKSTYLVCSFHTPLKIKTNI